MKKFCLFLYFILLILSTDKLLAAKEPISENITLTGVGFQNVDGIFIPKLSIGNNFIQQSTFLEAEFGIGHKFTRTTDPSGIGIDKLETKTDVFMQLSLNMNAYESQHFNYFFAIGSYMYLGYNTVESPNNLLQDPILYYTNTTNFIGFIHKIEYNFSKVVSLEAQLYTGYETNSKWLKYDYFGGSTEKKISQENRFYFISPNFGLQVNFRL